MLTTNHEYMKIKYEVIKNKGTWEGLSGRASALRSEDPKLNPGIFSEKRSGSR